jgi:hypothetical protein
MALQSLSESISLDLAPLRRARVRLPSEVQAPHAGVILTLAPYTVSPLILARFRTPSNLSNPYHHKW